MREKKEERKIKSEIFLPSTQIFSFDIISSAGYGNFCLHMEIFTITNTSSICDAVDECEGHSHSAENVFSS